MDVKYEKTVIECKYGAAWFKKLLIGILLSFQKKYFIFVRFEYGEIVNSSEISNGIDEIDDVWNQSDNETVPD